MLAMPGSEIIFLTITSALVTNNYDEKNDTKLPPRMFPR